MKHACTALRRNRLSEEGSSSVEAPIGIRTVSCRNLTSNSFADYLGLQDVEGENYLGIQLLRFYFRCAACSAEFILKTDPANTDYTMEKGATRNYEPWREKERDVAQAVADREEEERGNAMKVRRSSQLHFSYRQPI